jgi:hypothetical protein
LDIIHRQAARLFEWASPRWWPGAEPIVAELADPRSIVRYEELMLRIAR